MSSEECLRWGVANLAKIFQEMPANFEGGISVVWDAEPWSLGCAAYYAPGENDHNIPYVAAQEGRIHFAGEHTSVIYVMEGAAQSGIRVAQEINAVA